MTLIKCNACGSELSRKAPACPKCGHPNKESNNLSGGQIVGGLIAAAIGVWWFAGGGLDTQVASNMSKLEDQVAADAVKQYNIAKRQGDPIQICVQAGMVSAAYLQAEDEGNYQGWKRTEEQDCKRAGIGL